MRWTRCVACLKRSEHASRLFRLPSRPPLLKFRTCFPYIVLDVTRAVCPSSQFSSDFVTTENWHPRPPEIDITHHIQSLLLTTAYSLLLLIRFQCPRLLAVAQPSSPFHPNLTPLHLLPCNILRRNRLLTERTSDQTSLTRSLNLLSLAMPSSRLVAPVDLTTICFAMFLRVQTSGLDGCAGVYEEQAGHCEGCCWCYHGLQEYGLVFQNSWIRSVEDRDILTRPLRRYRCGVGRDTSASPSVLLGTESLPPIASHLSG